MALVSGYPAMLLGLAAGVVLVRRAWAPTPVLIAGALAFAVLVARTSTMPGHVSEAGDTVTPFWWVVLAAVNAGCWCLGIGMGVAAGRARPRRY